MIPSTLQHALITADDWGMSPGVNEGILDLAKRGLIRRISCMAKGKFLTHEYSSLSQLTSTKVGLHFDLTFGKSAKEIRALIFDSFFRPKKIKPLVLSEFRTQWDKLKSIGLNPTYLDGHHHIHLLPGVLSALLEEAKYAGVEEVRTVCDPFVLGSKKAPIYFLSLFAKNKLLKNGYKTLPCWYPNLERIGLLRFKNGLRSLKQDTEVIVHPAKRDDFKDLGIDDSYSIERIEEFLLLEQV